MPNRREVDADQRRALELLSAAAHRKPMKAGERQIEVARVTITTAGRKAIEGRAA